MNYNKKTILDVDVAGKKILLRCDFNVPQDKETGAITSDKRIVAALPTIRCLLEQKAAKLAAEMNVNSGTVSRNLYGLFKMGYLETRGDGERVNYITRLDNLEQVFHWVAEYIGGIG